MSQRTTTPHRSDVLNLDSGLEGLDASDEFRGPVEPLDGDHCNDHLAMIYEDRGEQFDALVPFVRQGLDDGERCMCVVDETPQGEIVAAMRNAGIDVDAALDSGALSFHGVEETYLRDGEFDPDRMIEFYDDAIAEATAEYDALRVTADTGWILDETTRPEKFMEYESKVNDLFHGEECIALCQYDRDLTPPEVLRNVIETHPHLICDGTACHNFYYTPPEEFFGPDAPGNEVDRMMGTLVDRTEARTALQRREMDFRELYETTSDPDLDFQGKLARLLELGRERFDLGIGFLSRIDGDAFQVIESVGSHERIQPGDTAPLSKTYCRQIMGSDGPMGVADAAAEGWEDDPAYGVYELDSFVGTTVTAGAETYGTLCFADRSPRGEAFTDAEYTFLELMGQWLSYELDCEERERYLREQTEITADPNTGFEEKLQRLFDLGCDRFGLELGGMARVDPDADTFEIEHVSGDHEQFEPGFELPLSETYCTAATDSSRATGVTDPADGYEDITVHSEFGLRSYLGTHVEVDGGDDRTFFFVSSEQRDEPFTEEELTYHRLLGQWVKYELERRQRERALRERTEHLGALVETTPECIKTVAEDGTLLQMNSAGLDMVEADAEENVTGENVYDLIAPEHRDRFREFNERICRGERGTLEFDVIGLEGTRRHMESHAAPLNRPDGSTAHVALTRDVTEQKQRETELRQTKNRFETVFDQSDDAIFLVDPDADEFVDANRAACKRLGYARDELLSMGWTGIHTDDAERVSAFLDEVRETGSAWTEDLHCRAKNGEEIPAEVSASPITLDGRSLVLANVRYIGERKKHERYQRELHEVTAAPDLAFEEKLDRLFELGCDRFGLQLGGLARVDPESDLFEIQHVHGEHEHLQPGARASLSETYCRVVADNDETVGIVDPEDGFEGTVAREEFGVKTYLGTRIRVNGGLDRTLFFVSTDSRDKPFSEEERTFHRLMGQWVKYGLEREQRERRLAALNDASRDLMAAESAGEVTDCVIEAATDLGMPVTSVALWDERDGSLRPAGRTDAADALDAAAPFAAGDGVGWRAFVENESLRETDTVGAADDCGRVTDLVAHPIGSEGVVVTGTTEPNGFSSTELEFAETVAANTSAALCRAEREQQLHDRESTLAEQKESLERLRRINDTIRDIQQSLVSASTRTEIAEVVCRHLADVGPYELAWIGDHDRASGEVRPTEWAGTEKGYLDEVSVTTDAGDGDQPPTAAAVQTREAVVVNELLDDPPFDPWRQAALSRGYHAAIALPIDYEDSLFGVLTVCASESGVFDELERAVLSELSDTIAYAINAVESKKALVSDELTELELELSEDRFGLVRFVRETGCEFVHENTVVRADGDLRAFFCTRGPTAAEVESYASALPLTGLELLSEREDDEETVCRFEAHLTDESITATVFDHGGRLRNIRADAETATVTVDLAADAETREFVEMFRSKFPAAELAAKRTRERSERTLSQFRAELTEGLTARQRETLQTAYFSGYFEKPRLQTGSDVAAAMDISQPTFNNHLRAAQRKLYDELLEAED